MTASPSPLAIAAVRMATGILEARHGRRLALVQGGIEQTGPAGNLVGEKLIGDRDVATRPPGLARLRRPVKRRG